MSWLGRLWGRWRRRGEPATLSERYGEIARSIDPHDLQRSEDDDWLTEADLIGDLTGDHYRARRILDFYTEEGFQWGLERYGLLDKIRQLGFDDLRFAFDTADPKRQHITCHGTKDGAEHLLMDLMMGRIHKPAPEGLEPGDDLELLSLEWMMLQNPSIAFSADHPRWPGQDHPGLGLNQEVMLLHIQSAKRLGLDGIVSHPSRYHIANLGHGYHWFFDPEVQGRFDALREVLAELDLSDATWRMERGEVRWAEDDTPVEWLPGDLVYPISDRLADYFRSPFYEEPRARSHARSRNRGISFRSAAPRS